MPSLALLFHLLRDFTSSQRQPRVPEPRQVMNDPLATRDFMRAGQADGILAFTYLYHAIQTSAVIPAGGRVLDLGCGPANQLAVIARLNPDADFIGMDASAEMLALAADTLQRSKLHNVRLQHGRIEDLDGIADQSCDALLSTITLHHLADTAALGRCLQAARRVLKPGGGLYLVDFGRLHREATQRFFASERAAEQPALFTEDYYHSLRAAFSVEELRQAAAVFGNTLRVHHTFLVPFMVALRSHHPHALRPTSAALAKSGYAALSPAQQRDFRDLARFFAHGGLPLACRPWRR